MDQCGNGGYLSRMSSLGKLGVDTLFGLWRKSRGNKNQWKNLSRPKNKVLCNCVYLFDRSTVATQRKEDTEKRRNGKNKGNKEKGDNNEC